MTKPHSPRTVLRSVALALIVALAGAACSNDSSTTAAPDTTSRGAGAGAVTVDIVYVSHIPDSEAVVDDIVELLADNPDVTVTPHDIVTPDGQAYATDNGVNAEFVVLVDGTSEHTIDGRSVEFTDFPQGRGTSNVPDGNWTLDDLQSLTDTLA